MSTLLASSFATLMYSTDTPVALSLPDQRESKMLGSMGAIPLKFIRARYKFNRFLAVLIVRLMLIDHLIVG